MNFHEFNGKTYHFIGCGGAGMSCLCVILKELGANVSGSDLKETDTTLKLRQKGIKVNIGHCAENLPDKKLSPLIVYSAAVRDSNPELQSAKFAGFECYSRGQFLARLSRYYKRTIAVAGSHGKTSITAMLAYVLQKLDRTPGYMIGGKVTGWDFSAAAGNGGIFVTESDESDGTLTLMQPYIGIISNIDDDHSWSVGGEDAVKKNFVKFAQNSQNLVYFDSEPASSLLAFHNSSFRIGDELANLIDSKNLHGFQRRNAALVVKALELLGIEQNLVLQELSTFPGVERRMSIRYESNEIVLVEDYAHHPTELSASISAIRERWPQRRLFAVFQPHRQARLEKYFKNFACELRKADKVFVLPVFAAWCDKGELSSRDLACEIGKTANFADGTWNEIADIIAKDSRKGDLIAIIGAGDLDELIPPLKEHLKNFRNCAIKQDYLRFKFQNV